MSATYIQWLSGVNVLMLVCINQRNLRQAAAELIQRIVSCSFPTGKHSGSVSGFVPGRWSCGRGGPAAIRHIDIWPPPPKKSLKHYCSEEQLRMSDPNKDQQNIEQEAEAVGATRSECNY